MEGEVNSVPAMPWTQGPHWHLEQWLKCSGEKHCLLLPKPSPQGHVLQSSSCDEHQLQRMWVHSRPLSLLPPPLWGLSSPEWPAPGWLYLVMQDWQKLWVQPMIYLGPMKQFRQQLLLSSTSACSRTKSTAAATVQFRFPQALCCCHVWGAGSLRLGGVMQPRGAVPCKPACSTELPRAEARSSHEAPGLSERLTQVQA